jgi:guanylate kinase
MDTQSIGRLIVVSGPSGVGKDTVLDLVFDRLGGIQRSVSCTTRPPRDGEVEGRDYVFLSPEQFEAAIRAGLFLEYAEYGGNRYGTLRDRVRQPRAMGIDVILKIEVQGALKVRSLEPDCVLVFVQPPSIDELERRLRLRGTDAEERIAERLCIARQEVECIPQYDYLVTNDQVEEAADILRAIIVAERHRVGPHPRPLPQEQGRGD